jgi:hypothetical protein
LVSKTKLRELKLINNSLHVPNEEVKEDAKSNFEVIEV